MPPRPAQAVSVRVSTDARWTKILGNYGRKTGFGFWGEFAKVDQEIAAAHGMVFAGNAFDFGSVGPLAGHRNMADNIQPMVAWASKHLDLLDGRDERLCAAAVWRSTATNGFVRHTPVWAACSLEQMLFENHLPFTILLDQNLDEWLTGRRALFLPMTSCVSDEQAALIVDFVRQGGGLLLLGDAGTRDERTRVRERHAFAEMLPADALRADRADRPAALRAGGQHQPAAGDHPRRVRPGAGLARAADAAGQDAGPDARPLLAAPEGLARGRTAAGQRAGDLAGDPLGDADAAAADRRPAAHAVRVLAVRARTS